MWGQEKSIPSQEVVHSLASYWMLNMKNSLVTTKICFLVYIRNYQATLAETFQRKQKNIFAVLNNFLIVYNPRWLMLEISQFCSFLPCLLKTGHFVTNLFTNCLWTVMSEQNLQSCLKSRNSQNPFCHILETLNKNYEKKFWNDMFIEFRFMVSQSL